MIHVTDHNVDASQIRSGWFEPGNGTRYTAAAVFVPGGLERMGVMGTATGGGDGCWLVASGNTGRAHLFQPNATGSEWSVTKFVHPDYVAEKFDMRSKEDATHAAALIARLIGRPGPKVE